MEFYNKVGKKAIGSRLRGLSDLITNDAAKVYQLYDIDMQPRWWPVFYVLTESGENSSPRQAQAKTAAGSSGLGSIVLSIACVTVVDP